MRSSVFRLWLLRRVLSLPTAVLRFLAGGGVVHDGGRTLDPQIQFLWRTWFTRSDAPAFPLTGRTIEAARDDWREAASLMGIPAGLRVRLEPVGTEGAALSAPVGGVLIRPYDTAPDAAVLVLFHQGGGVLGGSELSRAFGALLAHHGRMPVFIPDYRLAPAHRFPAALDDARLALDWAQSNAYRLGAADGQVAVGGILTGAALALRLCLDLKRDFKPLPVGQMLITPLLDLSDDTLPTQPGSRLWPVSAADVDLMASHYAGAGVSPADTRVSPALEPFLVGQPRTLIVSGGLDPVAAQAERFARRLIEARVKTVYRRYDSLPLGFDLLAGVVDEVQAATADIARNWVEMLRTGAQADADKDAA